MNKHLKLSALSKIWILDVDGTIVKHNGHLNGGDQLLDGVKDFFSKISEEDFVILLTARESIHKNDLVGFLEKNGVRYNQIHFDMPKGERILVNDCKPSGLETAHAINLVRDCGLTFSVEIDGNL